jgi:hypothetical protein
MRQYSARGRRRTHLSAARYKVGRNPGEAINLLNHGELRPTGLLRLNLPFCYPQPGFGMPGICVYVYTSGLMLAGAVLGTLGSGFKSSKIVQSYP